MNFVRFLRQWPSIAVVLFASMVLGCDRPPTARSPARSQAPAPENPPVSASEKRGQSPFSGPVREKGECPLSGCGRAICRGDGSRFRWRGVTAFALADLVADGKEDQARAFMQWAAGERFTVLRVLATNHGWMSLTPEDGRRAAPRMLAMAREYGLYVQLVALAGTREGPLSTETAMREQIREIGRICKAAGNCVLEIANEPYHGSQAGLEDPSLMRRLQAEVPSDMLVAWGAADEDRSTIMAGGSYVVVHLARNGPRWTRMARARQLVSLSEQVSKFVVDNEAIGAAEADVSSRRDSSPAAFFAQGLLSRLFEIGANFHCEDCLRAHVPGPIQKQCASAFIAGATWMPDGMIVRTTDPGTSESPVDRLGDSGVQLFSGVSGSHSWVVALGANAPAQLPWREGWRPVKRDDPWPEVRVWTAARAE